MIIDNRGRPNLEAVESIKQKIVGLIEQMTITHPERLRKAYNEHYRQGNGLSWATLRKYLDQLKAEGKIREEVITQGKRKTISVIRSNF